MFFNFVFLLILFIVAVFLKFLMIHLYDDYIMMIIIHWKEKKKRKEEEAEAANTDKIINMQMNKIICKNMLKMGKN